MNTILLIIFIIAYIFGGIGYLLTVKQNCEELLKSSKLITILLFVTWAFWLIVLGFAATMTEIECYIRHKLGYNW